MKMELFLDSILDEKFVVEDKVMASSGKKYEVGERIGCGGNAVVHQCFDVDGDELAIKFLLRTSWKRKCRFMKEIEVLRCSKHEQLVKYVGDGSVEALRQKGPAKARSSSRMSLVFFLMPKADSNLKDLILTRRHVLRYEDYIGQFKGLSRALGVLHERAVHRDIKPENVLVKGETWLLSDFGLCKFLEGDDDLSGVNEAIGPRYWMSPEAINRAIGNDDVISKRSDVFQLCSVFWYAVTGRHPCGNVTASDWTGAPNLFPILDDALSYNVTRRPADGNELARRLEDVAFLGG